MKRLIAQAGILLLCLSCGGALAPTSPDPSPAAPPAVVGDAIFVGAGDIAQCGLPGAAATAALLDLMPGTIFTAGDNAYPSGSSADFQKCYEPTWGRHKARTKPIPGNHEYQMPGASDYFSYFGASAGAPGQGFYSYDLESWHVVALNSSIPIDAGSHQLAWLTDDLTRNTVPCTLVYFHHPVFSSGYHGDHPHMRSAWQVLYDFAVDVAVAGHDHDYERFAPQDGSGVVDLNAGVREFVVGTGGADPSPFITIRPNSEVRGSAWGVLKFTLRSGRYDWEFVPAAGARFSDAGSGLCH